MAFVGNVPGTVFIPSAEFLNDSFQANGQPTAANNIVFDGANNTDEQRGSNVGGQTRAANESIAGSADSHQPVRRGMGTRVRRGHQRRHQVGHQPVHRLRLQFLHEQGDDQPGLLHEGAGRREAGRRQERMGRHDRRTDRPEQAALLRQPRAALHQPEFQQHLPGAALAQLRRRERRVGVEHLVAARPSAEHQTHVGVPLAARKRAAVQPARRRPGNADELRRRDRPRPDDRRHADVGPDRHQGQHHSLWPRARRHRARQPGVAGAQARIRALRAVPGRRRRRHRRAGPILDYETFDIQSSGTMDYSDPDGPFDRQHVLVVHPGSEGAPRPEVRRALLAHLAEQPGLGQPAGHAISSAARAIPSSTRRIPRSYPGTAHHPRARRARLRHDTCTSASSSRRTSGR